MILLGNLFGMVLAIVIIRWLFKRARNVHDEQSKAAAPGPTETLALPAPARVSSRAVKKRWSACNILKTGPDARQLWQFDAGKSDLKPGRSQPIALGSSLATGATGKTWRSLWQPRLNVAWLPPGSVFLRVVHLPKASASETITMVELQLEKLSPIPLTQLVWSAHTLADTPQPSAPPDESKPKEDLQTLVVVIAERKPVEEFLGQLEGDGFFADRLELPILDEVTATPINGDGAWIYPGNWGGPNVALVAWWYGGVLRNLNFLTLPVSGTADSSLRDQVDQMTWAGELDGWLTHPPAWTLVADDATAAQWVGPLTEVVGDSLAFTPPLTPDVLATLTAKRALKSDPKVNLLPAEHLVRYQQAFVDRLWMRGLFAVGGVYMVGVLIYFLLLGVQNFRVGRLDGQIAALGGVYTNSIKLKEKYRVLKDRSDLKNSALDCWKSMAELMPETSRLDSFNFNDGKKLSLNGTCPKDDVQAALDFSGKLRKATVEGRRIFGDGGDQFAYRPATGSGGAGDVNWSFSLEIQRGGAR